MIAVWIAACGSPGPAVADASAPTGVPTCDPIFQPDGTSSGLVWCWNDEVSDGHLDRVEPALCDLPAPDPAAECGGWYGDGCTVNGDCGPNAVCGDAHGICACVSLCAVDADCGENSACVCGSLDRCLVAGCTRPADCASGVCGVATDDCGAPEELRCRSDADECAGSEDCPSGQRCGWADDTFRCVSVRSCPE